MYSLEIEARSVVRGAETVVLMTRRKIFLNKEMAEKKREISEKNDEHSHDAPASKQR